MKIKKYDILIHFDEECSVKDLRITGIKDGQLLSTDITEKIFDILVDKCYKYRKKRLNQINIED